jgi:amidase
MGGEQALAAAGTDARIGAVVAEGVTGQQLADHGWLPQGLDGSLQRGMEWVMYTAAGLLSGAARPIRAHLRIEAVDPEVNAVPVVLGEQALHAADAAYRAVAAGGDLPPLHGVPFVVKSNIDVAGTPTTQGLRAFADAYPRADAPIVERMKAAGAIPVGRRNMPNVAVRWHCESELYGRTVNPWDRSRTAGASSAAVAVALATGMCPLGLGNDGLGSLRHPAQCCGISVLKPGLGRVPDATTVPGPQIGAIGAQLVNVNGPLARRVADLRVAFEVIAGYTSKRASASSHPSIHARQ